MFGVYDDALLINLWLRQRSRKVGFRVIQTDSPYTPASHLFPPQSSLPRQRVVLGGRDSQCKGPGVSQTTVGTMLSVCNAFPLPNLQPSFHLGITSSGKSSTCHWAPSCSIGHWGQFAILVFLAVTVSMASESPVLISIFPL